MPKGKGDLSEAVRIGKLIKQSRKAAGMSQQRLADKIDVSYQQVQKYEKGVCQITLPRLKQFADVFGIPVTAFLGEMIEDEKVLGSNLSEDEAALLQVFRRMKPKQQKLAYLSIGKDLVNLIEGRA